MLHTIKEYFRKKAYRRALTIYRKRQFKLVNSAKYPTPGLFQEMLIEIQTQLNRPLYRTSKELKDFNTKMQFKAYLKTFRELPTQVQNFIIKTHHEQQKTNTTSTIPKRPSST